ncbi:ATP-binding protein [Streptomyces xanthochromogenes]|uniref:ATP-binding protein n=1 Tax=Streptomyces xanthochromogenes TaxID=67384 RepID=UPI003443D833
MSGPLRPPRPCAPFAGRAEETSNLREFLAAETGPGPRVLLLHGPAGVGKSALAAHLVAPSASGTEVPVCWMPAGGEAPDPTGLLLRVLGQLDAELPQLRLPCSGPESAVDAHAVRDACRDHFAAHPALVVFDDVRSGELAEALLDAFARTRAAVVLTARDALTLPQGEVRRHEVRPLDVHDSAVIAWRTGRRLLAGPEAEALLRLTGGLPLLLRLAGPLLEAGGLDAGETLREWERTFPADADGRWTALTDLAVEGLSGPCRATLGRLLLYGPMPFGLPTAKGLLEPAALGHIDELAAAGLLVRDHDGRWSVAAASISGGAAWQTPQSVHALFRSVREDLLAVLDGDASRAKCARVLRGTDEYLDMILRLPASRETLTGPLARLLTVRCDAYRLAVLRRALSAGRPRLRVEFAQGVRDPEHPSAVAAQRPSGGTQRAVAIYESGHLSAALRALGPESSWDATAGPTTATLRGRILCDQGWVDEAEAAFTDAAAGYRAGKQLRPGAWTSLHHAALLLLAGRPDAARTRTEQALAVFRRTGDERGQAWCATTLGRVHLATGHLEDGLVDLTAAKALHLVIGDLRGQAWTRYHLALADADQNADGKAIGELIAVADLFESLGDQFGAAWATHQLGLLERDSEDAQRLLREAARTFRDIDCPHGLAWTELALGSHPTVSPYPGLGKQHKTGHLEQARALFCRLGDRSGELWARYCVGLLDGDQARVDPVLGELATGRFTTSREARLLLEHRRGKRPAPYWRHAVPRRARDTISLARAGEPPVECRVRLTLLDGSPIRILLRVEAGDRHPWAADGGDGVWLRAVGTPLTPADIEPAMSLVRPSPLAGHGAEFTFTAHRPGPHRLRFTIADEQTGSVLQQVETEFDLPDTSAPHLVTAPHPEHARGA